MIERKVVVRETATITLIPILELGGYDRKTILPWERKVNDKVVRGEYTFHMTWKGVNGEYAEKAVHFAVMPYQETDTVGLCYTVGSGEECLQSLFQDIKGMFFSQKFLYIEVKICIYDSTETCEHPFCKRIISSGELYS